MVAKHWSWLAARGYSTYTGPFSLLTRAFVLSSCLSHRLSVDRSAGQQAGALLLGVVNVVGVITLSSLLVDPVAKLALYRQGLGFILGLLPYLQVCVCLCG